MLIVSNEFTHIYLLKNILEELSKVSKKSLICLLLTLCNRSRTKVRHVLPIFYVALIDFFVWKISGWMPNEAVSGSTDVTLL